jgi:hypothetical protein
MPPLPLLPTSYALSPCPARHACAFEVNCAVAGLRGSPTPIPPAPGFFGGLTVMNTDEMYAVKLSSPSQLRFRGTPVTLPKPVVLSSGWNYLPCPFQRAVSLAAGAPRFSYATGDHYRSQLYFAEYYGGYGWYGTLSAIEPGFGYKLYVAAGGAATFAA